MIADADIRAELEAALGRAIESFERRSSEYQTSFALDEVDVTLADGERLELMFKNSGEDGFQEISRAAKPEFLYNPLREIEVYRDVLTPAGISAPRFTAASPERGWLFVERVHGVELFQVGPRSTWEHVARWLARCHATLGDSRPKHALRYDRAFYDIWPERALEFAKRREDNPAIATIARIGAGYDAAVEQLLELPVTLAHGEFYASNVLVDDPNAPDRVAPVDWEQAAIAPGLVDLAALTSGRWSDVDRAEIAGAYRAAGGAAGLDDDAFARALAACRLHAALQWLGWATDWTPPKDHVQDWLDEAVRNARVLGLPGYGHRMQSARERSLRPVTQAATIDADPTHGFEFVVTGDSRPTLPNAGFPNVTHRLFGELRVLRPAFVLYTGDFMWGYNATRQEKLNDIDRFTALADTLGVPLFNSPGNHEMQSDPEAIAMLEERGHDLYGSFDVGPYHFIALNTDEFCLEGRIAGDQLEWLRADLDANATAAGIFVFMHRPMYSWFQGDFNPDDQAMLCDLFAAHPVRAVFAAHDHFYLHEEHAGVQYMTVAGAGSPMYAQPQRGGFAHYVIVSVAADGGVEYKVVEPGRLDVEYVAGNDGIEPLSIARVANTTDSDLALRNLEFSVPRLASLDDYQFSADYQDWVREAQQVELRPRAMTDCQDGSALVSLEVAIPTGVSIRVVVEARY